MKRKMVAVLLCVSVMLSGSIGVSAAEMEREVGVQTVEETEVTTDSNVEIPVATVMDVDFTSGDAADKSEMANSYSIIGNPILIDSTELHKKIAGFDGNSAYIYSFDDTKYEKISETVTIECMFKYNSIPNSGEYDVFSNQQSGGIGLGVNNGKLTLFAHVDGSYKEPTASIQAGQWVHAVGVVDGSAVKLYVNGKLVSQIAANGGVKYPSGEGAKNFLIGGDSDGSNGGSSYADGYVSFARIYDRALSEAEIAALNDQAFDGAELEELTPQQVNLGIVSSETAPSGGEISVNLHANGDKTGSVDKITYELSYDASLFTYNGVQYAASGVTVDDSTAGKLKVTYEGSIGVSEFKQYAATRLGQLLFKVKDTKANTQTTLKVENFQAFVQGEEVTEKMNMPQAEKSVTIYTKGDLDLNGDGVVGAGDVALAENQDQKKTIAEEATIYPYKHAVILTTDGGGSAWDPAWIYYAESNEVLPVKTSDPEIMAKRTNEYTMTLFNEEFATSYTATAVEPSISGQNYSAIIHGIPWMDVDSTHQVTNDSAAAEYYGDFGLETAKYPSMFKAVQNAVPNRSTVAFSEWKQILNGIIEPDAGVVGRPSASQESFYDVANYIKSSNYQNTAIVYMQSDWMDHVGHSTGYYNDTYWTEYKQYDDYFKAVVDALKETETYDETLIIANADHGGSDTGHGSTDPSNMDVFIGMGGQTVNSGQRLEGGKNSDIAALALYGLRIDKPESMTGEVFDTSAFLSQEEMSKKNRDIEKVTFTRNGETAALELSNPKSETRVIDAVIDLDGVSVEKVDAGNGTILRQEVTGNQLKLTISYDSQPETLAKITFNKIISENTAVYEIMLGTEQGKEIYPDLENTTETVNTDKTTPVPTQQPSATPAAVAGATGTDASSKATYKVTATGRAKTVEYTGYTGTGSTVTIPSAIEIDGVSYKVTSVAEQAFKGNTKLKTVVIPSSVTKIGKEAFSGCSKLAKVKSGVNVTSIGDKAFYNCKNLSSITMNKKLKTIGNSAFYNCEKLKKVTFNSKVSKIGSKAFYGCKSLKKITINTKKLTSKNVGNKAFKGINSKAVIKVPGSKLNSYKKLLKSKGVSSKAAIKK